MGAGAGRGPGGAGRGRVGKERREMAPRAGALRVAAASAAHSGFRPGPPDCRMGGGGGGAARPHSFLAWRAGRRWLPRQPGPLAVPAGPRQFLPPGRERSARAAPASGPERRRRPGTPAQSRAPSVRGPNARASLCTERAVRERPWQRRPVAPSGSGKPDPAPLPGRGNFHSRRYLVTRPRCHPGRKSASVKCVGCMNVPR